MAVDPEAIRRMIREDREDAERKAADKDERDDLRARLARLEKLEANREKPDHEAEPGDDHPFEP